MMTMEVVWSRIKMANTQLGVAGQGGTNRLDGCNGWWRVGTGARSGAGYGYPPIIRVRVSASLSWERRLGSERVLKAEMVDSVVGGGAYGRWWWRRLLRWW